MWTLANRTIRPTQHMSCFPRNFSKPQGRWLEGQRSQPCASLTDENAISRDYRKRAVDTRQRRPFDAILRILNIGNQGVKNVNQFYHRLRSGNAAAIARRRGRCTISMHLAVVCAAPWSLAPVGKALLDVVEVEEEQDEGQEEDEDRGMRRRKLGLPD